MNIEETYEAYKHLDKCLSDTGWCESGEAIYGIAGEMWRAIKGAHEAGELTAKAGGKIRGGDEEMSNLRETGAGSHEWPAISREKLIDFLKSAKVDVLDIDNQNRLMYCVGKNVLADILLVGIYCGDFDESPDMVPAERTELGFV